MTDLATQLVKFFDPLNGRESDIDGTKSMHPRSLFEFFQKDMSINPFLIRNICEKLTYEGVITHAGTDNSVKVPGLSDCYYSLMATRSEYLMNYGVYDNLVFGFPFILNKHSRSVVPVHCMLEGGTPDIGTAFILVGGTIVTARHCIDQRKRFSFGGVVIPPELELEVYFHADDRVDLAIVKAGLSEEKLAGPPLVLGEGNVLDHVLTIGYPPIPGFRDLQIAETATISGTLITSTGEIIASEKSYLTACQYLIFSARVKGGNSGGPVISKDGRVVGVVTDAPAGEGGKADKLGYGVATPSSELCKLLSEPGVAAKQNVIRENDKFYLP